MYVRNWQKLVYLLQTIWLSFSHYHMQTQFNFWSFCTSCFWGILLQNSLHKKTLKIFLGKIPKKVLQCSGRIDWEIHSRFFWLTAVTCLVYFAFKTTYAQRCSTMFKMYFTLLFSHQYSIHHTQTRQMFSSILPTLSILSLP